MTKPNTTTRNILLASAVLGAMGVGIGAFGAHGLEATLTANGRSDTFDTGSLYHLIHTLALLGVGLLSLVMRSQWLSRAAYAFIAGVIFFSGSLYVLSIFDVGIMGAIAPIGGTAFIVGWLFIGIAAWQQA